MRYILAMVMALMLFSVAIAASEKVTIGPYIVSFELNDSDKYTIENQNSSLGKNIEVEAKDGTNEIPTHLTLKQKTIQEAE